MKEINGDIIKTTSYNGKPVLAMCVTTNGVIKKDGKAVMGAGVAKSFRDFFPSIDQILANKLKENGNVVNLLGAYQPKNKDTSISIFSFPTKHHWNEDSDIELIKSSAKQLAKEIKSMGDGWVLLPKPGCRNGNLNWEDVKRVISPILPHNVIIISLD